MLLNIRPVPAPALNNLSATPSLRAIVLLWDLPNDTTYAGAEIWSNSTNNVNTAVKIGAVTTNTFTDSSTGVSPVTNRYYWVRSINIYGRKDGGWSNVAIAKSLLATNLDIGAAAVQASNLNVAAIDSTSGNLVARSVTTTMIQAGAITGNEIQANTITAREISTNYVYTNNLDANQIKTGKLSADRIDATSLVVNWSNVASRPSDDQIKNNLIDLSLWTRGYNPGNGAWGGNGEYNSIATCSPSGGADLTIPGPKGGSDLIWYCKEVNNDGGPGGGWDAPYFTLDKTKTYRFVITIRRLTGQANSYWGTHGVADLNTTTLNTNPYFANAPLHGLSGPDRWYLFVGYIYPAGSVANTHDSAGIWDCKTGQKVASGMNYCFMPDGQPVHHRAYQYYATANAEQVFGRPMINLVDGTEPSLREYFEAGAVMNTSISVNPDGSLNNAGGGKVTLPGIGQDTYRIFTKSNTATNAPSTPVGLYKNGAIIHGVQRSYSLVVIQRSTGAITWQKDYDVYGAGEFGGAKAYDLALDLNNLADAAGQYIVIVYTFDEPRNRREESGLMQAMYRNGASRGVFGSSQFQSWSAYALVGISGCGEGNGAEAYQGAVSADPNSWIDVSFGIVAGNLTSVTLNYVPKTLQDYGYTGSMNATSDIVLYSRGNITLSGNKAIKSVTDAWDSDVYTLNGFSGGAYAEARIDQLCTLMLGLNSDPTTDAYYGSIDYAIYAYIDGTVRAYSNGNMLAGGVIGNYGAGDVLGVKYDGSNVFFTKNGASLWSMATSTTNTLYFDSSMCSIGASMSNIRFGPLSDNSAGTAAYNAIPGINNAIADKISKTAASALQAPITISTNGLMLAGTTNNGVYMSPGGLFGVQNGAYTFAIPISGDPSFAGNITAKSGTLGSLTLASGGFIAQGYYGTWDWAAKAPGPGFLIHANGMLFGDYNNSNLGYVQISSSGTLSMPGFDYSNRQLTLTQPILINPKTQTSLSVYIPGVNLRNQTGTNVTVNVSPTISNGSGSYAYQWSVSEDNNRITISGGSTNSTVTLKATGSNIAYQGQVSLTIRDLNTQAVASYTASVYIQFGSGQVS